MQPDHETRGLAQHWQILIGMLAGAIIGILLNSTQGRSEAKVDVDALPPGLTSLVIVDSPDRVEIRYKTTDGDQHKIIVDGRQGADADVRPVLIRGGVRARPHPEALLGGLVGTMKF